MKYANNPIRNDLWNKAWFRVMKRFSSRVRHRVRDQLQTRIWDVVDASEAPSHAIFAGLYR